MIEENLIGLGLYNLFFDIEFFKYFFRVLHKASSSWLKLFRVFRLHPVYTTCLRNKYVH
jgi:hypothetical protein